jgi:2-phosphoglycerate kinase
MRNPLDWRVLLIGGSSAAGKTVVAQELAQRFGVSVLLVDDVRLAIQQVTTPAQLPDLHIFVSEQQAAQLTPELMRDGLVAVGRAIAPALKIIVAHHVVVAGAGPIIVEGDGILPELASQRRFQELKHFWGLQTGREVRAVFLFEPDEEAIFQNMRSRDRGFQDLAPDEQRTIARASWLYGHWLRQEALAHELPAVPARPWESLTERVLAAIEAE